MERLPFEQLREVEVKQKAETDPKYYEKRAMKTLIDYCIVNINKPSGPSSHQVSDYVKKILNISKAGHSGSLDPKVTGVLPIATGRATKIVHPLLKGAKEYVALMHLHTKVSEDKIREGIKKFIGTIDQLPPVKSAVKRQWRKREVYYFKILEIQNQDILFKIGCQAGTYIRKVISDLGNTLGTNAHMTQLVRTKVANFTDKNWHTLTDLKDAYQLYKEGNEEELKKIILPIEKAIEHLPKIWVLDTTVNTLCHGARLNIPGIARYNSDIQEEDPIAIMTLKNELICLGTAMMTSKDIKRSNKGTAVRTTRVFMERNTYPKNGD